MMPLDLPAQRSDIDRFIPQDGVEASWMAHARAAYAFDMASAVRQALKDLRLEHGRVAFDDMGFGFRLEVEGLKVADGYDPLMFARAVKTETELGLLQRATALYPGGEHERFWLEEVVAIGNDGGKPLFSWGFGPLTREGCIKQNH
jgi:hypothetical protein